jgi:hypothetical protein
MATITKSTSKPQPNGSGWEGNEPEAFARLPLFKQTALRWWVRMTLRPLRAIPPMGGTWAHSYGLKHQAEADLGHSVSNGEMKGAMVAEGYRWRHCEPKGSNPNWVFNSGLQPALRRRQQQSGQQRPWQLRARQAGA